MLRRVSTCAGRNPERTIFALRLMSVATLPATPCRTLSLFIPAEECIMTVDTVAAKDGRRVGFATLYPLYITAEESVMTAGRSARRMRVRLKGLMGQVRSRT